MSTSWISNKNDKFDKKQFYMNLSETLQFSDPNGNFNKNLLYYTYSKNNQDLNLSVIQKNWDLHDDYISSNVYTNLKFNNLIILDAATNLNNQIIFSKDDTLSGINERKQLLSTYINDNYTISGFCNKITINSFFPHLDTVSSVNIYCTNQNYKFQIINTQKNEQFIFYTDISYKDSCFKKGSVKSIQQIVYDIPSTYIRDTQFHYSAPSSKYEWKIEYLTGWKVVSDYQINQIGSKIKKNIWSEGIQVASFIRFDCYDSKTYDPINQVNLKAVVSETQELLNGTFNGPNGYYKISRGTGQEALSSLQKYDKKLLSVNISANNYYKYYEDTTQPASNYVGNLQYQLNLGSFYLQPLPVYLQWKCRTDKAVTNESTELVSAYVKTIDSIEVYDNNNGNLLFTKNNVSSDNNLYNENTNDYYKTFNDKEIKVIIRREGFITAEKILNVSFDIIENQRINIDLGQIELKTSRVQSLGFSCQRIFPLENNRTECLNDSATLNSIYLSGSYYDEQEKYHDMFDQRFNPALSAKYGYTNYPKVPDQIKVPCVYSEIKFNDYDSQGYWNEIIVSAQFISISGQNNTQDKKTYFETLREQLLPLSSYLPFMIYNSNSDTINVENTSGIIDTTVYVHDQEKISSLVQMKNAGLITYNLNGNASLNIGTFSFNDYADCLTFENVVSQSTPLSGVDYMAMLTVVNNNYQDVYVSVNDGPFTNTKDYKIKEKYECTTYRIYFQENHTKIRLYRNMEFSREEDSSFQIGFPFINQLSGGLVRVESSGNIMSLHGFSNTFIIPSNDNNFKKLTDFSQLFCSILGSDPECYLSQIILYSAPRLPATTLAGSCYWGMFQNCTNLKTAPELPATTLAQRCYCRMFQDCTNLVNAPILHATTLSSFCYEKMFQGCTALSSLPQNTYPSCNGQVDISNIDGCCMEMFKNCINLSGPIILNGIIDNSKPNEGMRQYQCMFCGCKSLKDVTVKNITYYPPNQPEHPAWGGTLAGTQKGTLHLQSKLLKSGVKYYYEDNEKEYVVYDYKDASEKKPHRDEDLIKGIPFDTKKDFYYIGPQFGANISAWYGWDIQSIETISGKPAVYAVWFYEGYLDKLYLRSNQNYYPSEQ